MNRTYRVMGLLLILLSIVVQSGLSAVAEAKPGVTTQQTEPRVTTKFQNGSFENGLTGWTIVNGNGVIGNVADATTNASAPSSVFAGQTSDFIDLGVDSLGGCVTTDMTDYDAIWTRSPDYGTVPTYTASNGAKPTNDHDAINSTYSSSAAVVTSIPGGPAITAGSNAIFMQMGSHWRATGYHILRGPAIVSDTFAATSGEVVNLNWYSAAGADDFAVFGYLVDTTTCTQYKVIETTGTTVTGWQFVSYTLPVTSGDLKFIFINGTFDKTGGKKSGASFWVDNISIGFPQTITFTLPASKNYTDPQFTMNGTATSALPITYVSKTPSICTVSGNKLTPVSAGSCSVEATQNGGDDSTSKTWASAAPVVRTMTITNLAPTNTTLPTATATRTATPTPNGQFITFATPPTKALSDGDFDPGATSSAGRPVTYVSQTPTVCTIVDGKVRMITGGDCTITANASAGGGYSAAPPVTRTFKIKKKQTITFPPVTGRPYTTPPFEIGASAESALPIAYTSETPSICEIVGTKVRLLAEGVCQVTANQSGGTNGGSVWEPAAPVTRSFNSLGLLQTITVSPDLSKRIYDPEFDISAVSDSTLPVTVVSNTPTICTIVGTKVKLLSGGRCVLRASQPGGNVDGLMYAAAENKFIRIDVNGATATLTRTPTRTMTPTPIPNLLKKAAVGSSFVLGLLQNGTLVTWGMNKEFQTNIPPCCANSITDVAVGTNFALALKGGRVYAWGANTRGQLKIPTAALKDVTSIAAGYAHGLALKKDGTIVCWGNNLNKQCNAPKGLKGVKAIAGGSEHTLAITKDDKVLGWGLNTVSQVKIPPTAVGVTAISAGCDHNLAIKKDGSVIAWGGNKYKQSNVPTNLKDAKSVGAGCHYSMALMQDGTIFGWGRNEFNQATAPVGITNAFSIGVGYVNSIISLRDGSVIAIGAPENGALITRTPTP